MFDMVITLISIVFCGLIAAMLIWANVVAWRRRAGDQFIRALMTEAQRHVADIEDWHMRQY